MKYKLKTALILAALLIIPAFAAAPAGLKPEKIRIATYNVEHFMKMFDQLQLPERSRNQTEQFRDEEDLFEVAQTLKLPDLNADILCIQEGPRQDMLELFNSRWMKGEYAFVRQFDGNRPGQWLCILARPGFECLDIREYAQVTDPVRDGKVMRTKQSEGLDKQNLLFARGPVFVKFLTPAGRKIWVGCTHVKSKYNNSYAVTEWRIREIEATRKICADLAENTDTEYVAVLGDFNDDFGKDYHEQKIGRDAVEQMLTGPGRETLASPTKTLARANPNLATYHCQIKPPKYRSFIDHIFVTPALYGYHTTTTVITDPIALVASDHLPVVAEFEFWNMKK